MEVEHCCSFQLGPDARSERLQGVDSTVYDVSGAGYVLHVIFGPYDGSQPGAGYRLAGKQISDGVELAGYRWIDSNSEPPEGRLLWLAHVGGGKIDGVNHTPWGLRITADCDTPIACDASVKQVRSIRF